MPDLVGDDCAEAADDWSRRASTRATAPVGGARSPRRIRPPDAPARWNDPVALVCGDAAVDNARHSAAEPLTGGSPR